MMNKVEICRPEKNLSAEIYVWSCASFNGSIIAAKMQMIYFKWDVSVSSNPLITSI